jgi:hypothetical protein
MCSDAGRLGSNQIVQCALDRFSRILVDSDARNEFTPADVRVVAAVFQKQTLEVKPLLVQELGQGKEFESAHGGVPFRVSEQQSPDQREGRHGGLEMAVTGVTL